MDIDNTPFFCIILHRAANDESRAVEATGVELTRETQSRDIPKQTMEELKSILRDSTLRDRDEAKPRGAYTYLHSGGGGGGSGQFGDDRTDHKGEFSTFKPQQEASRRGPWDRDRGPIEAMPQPSVDPSSAFRPELHSLRGEQEQALCYGTSYRGNREHQLHAG